MARLVFWRLVRTGLAVWALASAVYLLSHRDLQAAAQLTLPDGYDLPAGRVTPNQQQEAQRAIQQRLGLDLPLFYLSRNADPHLGLVQWHWNGFRNQYHNWTIGVLHGNWGTSFRTGQAVTVRLRAALAYTLPITGTAAVLTILLALALAQRLATAPWWQRPLRAVLTTVHALPLFVVALVLLLVFANPEILAWFPTYGLGQELDTWTSFIEYLPHLILPVVALTLTALPELTLQLDAALAQELHAGYTTTARAKGLTEAAVIRRHALRNALLPTIAQITELLPALVAGAVVVEVVFALPGMGRLLAEAAAARDYPVLVGGVLLTGATRLLALLLADLLYFWADPRIRWQS